MANNTLPMAMMGEGELAVIEEVRGDDELRHRLESLGFVAGVNVKAASRKASGIIIEVKGTQIALDRATASKILVSLC